MFISGLLVVKYMIAKLQSVDPENLGIEEETGRGRIYSWEEEIE